MPRLARSAALALLGLALVACSVAPSPPQRYYRIEVAAPPAPATPFTQRIVVEPVQAYGVYNERPLLYRADRPAAAMQQYNYYFWAEPPAVMLRDTLIAYLRRGFGADQVVQAGSRIRGDYVVHSRLTRFEHILAGKPRAAFGVQFSVTDAADRELFVLDFDREAPAAGGSVEDFVAAMDQLVAAAYDGLSERLRSAMKAS